jgi:hypothetical protein
MTREGFHFTSSLFEIEPREDEETNPRRYGKQLALWLKEKLKGIGYQTEVLPEDWGWCVICQRKPFLLWVGCGNESDYDKVGPNDPPPKGREVVWHCFPEAELPLLSRLFNRTDMTPALDKLDADLRAVLANEAGIGLTPAPPLRSA